MNVGLIGAGAISTYVLEELNGAHSDPDLTVTSILVRDRTKYKELENKYDVRLFTSIEAFLQSSIDIVVEAANVAAVTELLSTVIPKKDIVLISTGALADEAFLQKMKDITVKYGRQIYLPSGAIGGLDLVQNVAAVGKIEKVNLETRKPAHTLVDERIETEQIVFTGTASEAIKKYPKNLNVSIALALAGVGFDQTKVTMIADPTTDKNRHTIEISGEFGHAKLSILNNPLPTNPNTSYLAAISIIGTLKRRSASIKIGI